MKKALILLLLTACSTSKPAEQSPFIPPPAKRTTISTEAAQPMIPATVIAARAPKDPKTGSAVYYLTLSATHDGVAIQRECRVSEGVWSKAVTRTSGLCVTADWFGGGGEVRVCP